MVSSKSDMAHDSLIQVDATKYNEILKELSREARINSSLAELSRALVSSVPIEDITSLVLEQAKQHTDSKLGFVGYIDPGTGYLVSPTLTGEAYDTCFVSDKSAVFKKFGGLWGWVIKNKKPLLTNNPVQDPRSTGVPPGHLPIHRFLAVPAMLGDRLVGIVTLANAGRNYTERDIEVTERMGDLFALAVRRKLEEDRMARINQCFLSFCADPDENINRLTALCGSLLGAACAIYNRLELGVLCSLGQWNTPGDYKTVDKPDGHICYDVIKNHSDRAVIIRNLQQTSYADTDPNVIAYGLKTYMGHPVKRDGNNIGALCVVFKEDFIPSARDEKILGIIAPAIGVEEERKLSQEKLRESQDFNLAVLNSLTAHICVLDRSGRIIASNQAWEQFGKDNGASPATSAGIGLNYLEICRRAAKEGHKTAKEVFNPCLIDTINILHWNMPVIHPGRSAGSS